MEAKKKIALILGVILFLCIAGKFIYAQVTENLAISATVVPATLELSGFTIPNSLVTIANFGTAMGTTTSVADGTFSKTFSPLTPGTYEVTIYATDSFSTDTQPRTFTFTIQQNQVITYDNIILPPTIYATTPTFNQAQTGTVTVYGRPNATVYLVIDGATTQTLNTTTDSLGKGVFSINGGSFSAGAYDIYSYFEVAYPSNTLSITIELGPSSTPTPMPTATPPATPTPIEITGGPGPSATAGPAPSAGTATPNVSPRPNCPLPFNLLCSGDSDNSGGLDLDGEGGSIIEQLAGNAFDINGDGKTDALDLSIFLSNVSQSASTLNIFHAGAVENDGLCTLTNANPINFAGIILIVFAMVIILLIVRIIIHALGGATGYSLTQIFGIVLLITSAYFIYQSQSIQQGNIFSQLTSDRAATDDFVNQTISYDVFVSSNDKPLNTLDLYLSFNPTAMKLKTINLSESFASVVTKVEYSNKCGKIRIIGGIPKPATILEREFFVRNTFIIQKANADTSLVVFPGTRAFQVDDTQETDQFIPRLNILRFNK